MTSFNVQKTTPFAFHGTSQTHFIQRNAKFPFFQYTTIHLCFQEKEIRSGLFFSFSRPFLHCAAPRPGPFFPEPAGAVPRGKRAFPPPEAELFEPSGILFIDISRTIQYNSVKIPHVFIPAAAGRRRSPVYAECSEKRGADNGLRVPKDTKRTGTRSGTGAPPPDDPGGTERPSLTVSGISPVRRDSADRGTKGEST